MSKKRYRLTSEDREDIRARYVGRYRHDVNQTTLAAEYGVTRNYINMIVNGKMQPSARMKKRQEVLAHRIKEADRLTIKQLLADLKKQHIVVS